MSDRTDLNHSPARAPRLRHVPLILIGLVAIFGVIVLGDQISFDVLRDNREALLAYHDTHFTWLAVGFVLVYALIVAFLLPGAAIASVTGGFLFGLWVGGALNVTAATTGAVAIFLAARWGLGADLSARIDTSEGVIKALKQKLNENEIGVLFLMRLMPIVPFFVANLLPAMVGVKFRNYLWTTALGIIPGAIVYTWIGVGVGEVFDQSDTPDLSLIREPYILGPILGLAALAALPMIIKAIRGTKES